MARGSRRLDQHVKEALAQLLEEEISDPRLTLVSITDVEVTPDQKYATVYWSALDAGVVSRDPARTGGASLPAPDEVSAGFEAARARLQGLLARRLRTRNTPELRFRPDPVATQAARVEDLLRRVHDEPVDPADETEGQA